MRWKKELHKSRETRLVRKFLLRPKRLEHETRWLEFAWIVEEWRPSEYTYESPWRPSQRDVRGRWEALRWAEEGEEKECIVNPDTVVPDGRPRRLKPTPPPPPPPKQSHV